MPTRTLRLGVVGLGRLWRRRYGPALARLGRHFRVVAVCDPCHRRAEREARLLDVEAHSGPAALLERDDIDAALVVGSAWYRLWPIERAAHRGLPTLARFSARQLLADAAVLDEVRRSAPPLMIDLTARFTPALRRLREILREALGPAQLFLADVRADSTLPIDPTCHLYGGAGGLDLLDAVIGLFGGPPASVAATAAPGGTFATIVLAWNDGRSAEVRAYRSSAAPRGVFLRVVAERGVADMRLPRGLRWSERSVEHIERLQTSSAAEAVLESFHRAVTEGERYAPGIEDVHGALSLLVQAGQSQEEGKTKAVEG